MNTLVFGYNGSDLGKLLEDIFDFLDAVGDRAVWVQVERYDNRPVLIRFGLHEDLDPFDFTVRVARRFPALTYVP